MAGRKDVFYFINDNELGVFDTQKDTIIRTSFNTKYFVEHFNIADIDVSDRHIHVLSNNGYFYFSDSNINQLSAIQFDFRIATVAANGANVAINNNELQLQYASNQRLLFTLHFLNPQNENFKKTYSITKENEAEIPIDFDGNSFSHANLSPGTYTLKISTAAPELKAEKTIIYTINILPQFWQTSLFQFACIILIIANIIAITYYLLRKKQQKKLNKIFADKHLEELENKVFLNQLNPHFLYNSLNTLQDYLIQKDTHNGIIYLQRVAGLSRSIIDFHKSATITVAEEIQFLERYLFIQQRRFADKFSFDILCPEPLLIWTLPPMLLQPLVENAIEHGFTDSKKGGTIIVKFSAVQKELLIAIEDNGKGNVGEIFPLKEGHALSIINQRLNLSINNKQLNQSFISVRANHPSGIIISLKIPQQ